MRIDAGRCVAALLALERGDGAGAEQSHGEVCKAVAECVAAGDDDMRLVFEHWL